MYDIVLIMVIGEILVGFTLIL